MYGKQVMLSRRSHRLAMTDDIDNSFEIGNSDEMMLHTDFRNMYVLLGDLIELVSCYFQQMIILFESGG